MKKTNLYFKMGISAVVTLCALYALIKRGGTAPKWASLALVAVIAYWLRY
jgi:hypothetical protein